MTTCLHPKEQKQFYETQNAINSCITDASQAFLLAQQNAANINEIKQA
ncbi:hypothetical protein GW750_05085 [bacterium]|nr:hypothetical protein [bacterium]